MKISISERCLIIDCGTFRPRYEIPVASIAGWSFNAEENGATYFAFQLDSVTQHVSITTESASKLENVIEQITEILKYPPKVSIAHSRCSLAKTLIRADAVLTTTLLTGILGSMLTG
ncbi:hypothetical protein BTA51_06665 [Hahella sp. CCB-MM4]|uniref:hypothetical protein n=1 Tax=Hahella sp. (strain CCB-MM4) TaxID=1926491 RepID=UPI000B9A695A|nr:hypothetical protein [Hahella sp. CCB-MM4]OZG74662.1 hypothetical protein BTA51_06665 [Hahella sp. CCB-MM4]